MRPLSIHVGTEAGAKLLTIYYFCDKIRIMKHRSTHNLLDRLGAPAAGIMAVVGALTMFLHSCDGTRPEGPTVICTGEDMHPVKPGETLTGILRTEAAKGRLSRTELPPCCAGRQ